MFTTSDDCRKAIEAWEGCKLTAYKIPGENFYTIGYGHTGADVTEGMTITQDEADKLFAQDLKKYEGWTYYYAPGKFNTQNEFDALLSFCYNSGPGNLQKAARNADTIAMLEYMLTKNGGMDGTIYKGLMRRRICEVRMFLTGNYNTAVVSGDYAAFYDDSGNVIAGCLDEYKKESEDIMTGEEIYKALTEYMQTLPTSDYAKEASRKGVESGMFADGDGDGLVDAPHGILRRQDLAVVLNRMGLLDK